MHSCPKTGQARSAIGKISELRHRGGLVDVFKGLVKKHHLLRCNHSNFVSTYFEYASARLSLNASYLAPFHQALKVCGLFTACFLISCADPDERMPWPTLQEMPVAVQGRWSSKCMTFDKNSRFFEVKLSANGGFKAYEYHYVGANCLGIIKDVRERSGKAKVLESLGESSWKFQANIKQPYFEGDLMDADFLVAVNQGKLKIKPICAGLYGLAGIGEVEWPEDSKEFWELSRR